MNTLQKSANSSNSVPRSDLDVFVELKEPDPFVMFDIKEELEHICNCKIDLLRLRKNLRSLISQRIEKDGIYA